MKNNATNQEFNTTTTDNGTFNVSALISGNYTVTIAAPGFKTAIVPDVKVDVGTPSSVNVTLEVGAPTETVQVVDVAGELINTQSATVGTTITGRQIIDQPQASRDALDLVTLLPGVQTTGRPRTSTVNGLPKGALNITLDGVDVQDNLISSNDGFFTFVRPRIDAVGEVSISTAAPGAESAGDGAVQIKFVTRGGTNELAGSSTGIIVSHISRRTISSTIKRWLRRISVKLHATESCSTSTVVESVDQSGFQNFSTAETKHSSLLTTKSFACRSSNCDNELFSARRPNRVSLRLPPARRSIY